METIVAGAPLKQVGRYAIFDQIGEGGMAKVHLARFSGPAGFSRVVAVKHLLPHLALDDEFKALIIHEARTASRVRHPNVVPTLDVVLEKGDVYIVMEYVPGEALSFLRRAAKEARRDIPAPICSAILVGVLQGLHAAHEARTPSGDLLDLVHRDVSPPNILVGSDGVPVVLDFGIAKTLQLQGETRSNRVKGKSSYMAPEQIRGEPLTRAVDIFAASVVLWELLTGRRLFYGATEQERMHKVLEGSEAMPPSLLVPRLPRGLDDVVMKGLHQNPQHRFKTALEMAEAIERVAPPASQRVVAKWVAQTAGESLRRRGELLQQIEISDLAIPSEMADATRGTGASQLSYAPIAPAAPAPAGRGRSRRAVIEGAAVGLVAVAILLMVTRSGRSGAGSDPLPPTSAHAGTAPLVVPASAATPVPDLFVEASSPPKAMLLPLDGRAPAPPRPASPSTTMAASSRPTAVAAGGAPAVSAPKPEGARPGSRGSKHRKHAPKGARHHRSPGPTAIAGKS